MTGDYHGLSSVTCISFNYLASFNAKPQKPTKLKHPVDDSEIFYWQHLNFLIDTHFPLFVFFKPSVVLSDLDTGVSCHIVAEFCSSCG